MERTFDRVPGLDPRSRSYPVRPVAMAVASGRGWSRVKWSPPPVVLDQGREGACVGFGWVAEALASPVRVQLKNLADTAQHDPDWFARYVYREARKVDPWDGEDYEGTSVGAGAAILKRVGFLKEYRWVFGLYDLKLALLSVGPVVLGVNWYSGMYEAPRGQLIVRGSLVGGHCLLARGYDPDRGFLLRNSWGPDWGVGGDAWITHQDMARLLVERGEGCVPFRRSYGKTP